MKTSIDLYVHYFNFNPIKQFFDKYQVYHVPSEYCSLQKINKYISWKARRFYIEENRDRK